MSGTVRGVVGRINKRETTTGKTAYSFALKGQDGWYSAGFNAPQFAEGSSIQFEFEQNGNFRNAKNIVPWTSDGEQVAPPVKSFVNKAGGRSFGGKSEEEKAYWSNRDAKEVVTQRRIEIQAARNAAIETVKVLATLDAVKMPTKQADKYDVAMALIDEITSKYLGDTAARLNPVTPVAAPEAAVPANDEDESVW